MTNAGTSHVKYSVAVLLLFTGASAATGSEQVAFSGKIVDGEGRPIVGAEVRLYEMAGDGGTSSDYEVKVLQEMTADSDGAFSFAGTGGDGYRQAMIVARRQGLALGWAYWTMREDEERDIALTQPQRLGGVVVDTEGKPLPDVTVFVAVGQIGKREGGGQYLLGPLSRRLLAAESDASGRFALNDLPRGATFELGAERPGYATMTTIDRSSPGETLSFTPGRTDIKLVMQREARIEGRVVQRDSDQSLEGVSIVIRSEEVVPYFLPEPARLRTDGTFSFDALLPGAYTITVGVPERGLAQWVATPVQVTLGAGQTKEDVTVEISKGGIVEFVVTDAAGGQPIDQARVSTRRAQDGQWYSAVSNEEGVARLRLAPGGYQLTSAGKTGYARNIEEKVFTVTDGQTQRVSLTLQATPRVTGVVRDSEGKPVVGAAVTVLPGRPDEALSDSSGRYELVWDPSQWGERDTTFCLLVRHPQRNLAAAVEMGAETQTINVKLEPGVALGGKVVAPDGQGIAGARIMPMLRVSNWGAPMTRERVQAEPDGSFTLAALPRDQRYGINASADGYGSATSDVEADRMQGERLDLEPLTLPVANLSISGEVVDADGNPMAGVRLDGYGQEQPDRVSAQTDDEGRFTIDGVCAGRINLRVDATREDKRLSGRMVTEGGMTGVRIVVREGRSPTQYHSGKTYEQIVAAGERVLVGVVVDESGAPVAGVPVGVCCHKRIREDGRMSWMYSSFPTLKATTDKQGRFAIELEEDGEYNLLFSPDEHAATIVYDIPVNTKDLRVTLENGGTLEGRLVRLEGGQKVPIPNAEVRIEQTDRAAYTHLGFERDRTTLTDAEGHFRFEHVQTGIRPSSSRKESQWTAIPRVWQLSHGDKTETLAFTDGARIEDFELLIKPDIDSTAPLAGNHLPAFEGMAIEHAEDQTKDKAVLLCFFDFQQRPSRNTLMQLTQQADSLAQKGIVVVVIQASQVDGDTLDTWAKDNSLPFLVGTITGDIEATRATWRVTSLPWLILTDSDHTVLAEGFGIGELRAKIRELTDVDP
ncbi:MAG: carboxypeptidase regulatory-like domain-containing protein [Sedimentisphaerales bacterium]|nr:carboxypeptidase regulatory-like domain-containing protein [Sedimentisphaerales bacterium]